MQHVRVTGAAGTVALEQGRGTVVLGHSVGELRRGRGGAVGRLTGTGRRGCAAALAREQAGAAARVWAQRIGHGMHGELEQWRHGGDVDGCGFRSKHRRD